MNYPSTCFLCNLDLDDDAFPLVDGAHASCIATGATDEGELADPSMPCAWEFGIGGMDAWMAACDRAFEEQFARPLTPEAARICEALVERRNDAAGERYVERGVPEWPTEGRAEND